MFNQEHEIAGQAENGIEKTVFRQAA
uniref:Uncharacterized protein n=1 Tax=Rhizophora mucronata TaxID=61149 RepID=A0A2P2LJG0_RHIMU